MALAVSFLGVANTLAISVLQRRREIGLLRSVGATRGQVAWSVAAQALLIGLLGIILGVGLGVVLEHYVLDVLMVQEAGYVFASLFPLLMTVVTAAFVIGAAQLAAAVPASQAAYQSIADAIAYE
jgi:putative ABC transport system permease protein